MSRHLSLEQCDKLASWGFDRETEHFYSEGLIYCWVDSGSQEIWNKSVEVLACPTLEELIMWLGDKFGHLDHYDYVDSNDEQAWTYQAFPSMEELEKGFHGDTPLEACYALAEALYGGKEENAKKLL